MQRVLVYSSTYLPDKVGPDVSRLGVDTTTELHEERDERRTEAIADDEERDLVDRESPRGDVEHVDDGVKNGDTPDAHRESEDRREGAAAEADQKRLAVRPAGSAGDADVGLGGHEHGDVAGGGRGCGADGKGGRPEEPQRVGPELVDPVRDFHLGAEVVRTVDAHGDEDPDLADRRELDFEEPVRAVADRVRDRPHRGRPVILRQHPPRYIERKGGAGGMVVGMAVGGASKGST